MWQHILKWYSTVFVGMVQNASQILLLLLLLQSIIALGCTEPC
jgi:hypothetical protein